MRLFRCICPSSMSVEKWANRCSKIATADEIIAAAVVQSIATHYEDWVATGEFKSYNHYNYSDITASPCLINSKKNVKVVFNQHTYSAFIMADGYYRTGPKMKGTKVNGIEISSNDAFDIWKAWKKLDARHKAVKAAEAKALSAMTKNEKAWDLVESLLKMRRNEFGALVPIETVEG